MTARSTCIVLIAAVLACLTTLVPGQTIRPAQAAGLIPAASVDGPLAATRAGSGSRGYPFGAALQDLGARGYVEEEFFLSGETLAGPYTTRVLVRRPVDPADFSGTVLTEWTNVSLGFDVDCFWQRSADQLMRQGDAYVAVDAQTVGLDDPETGLKAWSPQRYAELTIPQSGTFVLEEAGYEIFAQALAATRTTGSKAGVSRLLGPLEADTQIATGCSQSAGTVAIFANTVGAAADLLHDAAGAAGLTEPLVDGYLLSSLATGTLVDGPSIVFPNPLAEPSAPVMQVNTESDPGFIREPDNDKYRLWEVAGTTHSDANQYGYVRRQYSRDFGEPPAPLGCTLPPLSRVPFDHVQSAAFEALKLWIATGKAPPSQPQIRYDSQGNIVRDAYGNAEGGIRLPAHAAPTATNSSVNAPAAGKTGELCRLVGSHQRYPQALLRELYSGKTGYVDEVQKATRASVQSGVLLPHHARATIRSARNTHLFR